MAGHGDEIKFFLGGIVADLDGIFAVSHGSEGFNIFSPQPGGGFVQVSLGLAHKLLALCFLLFGVNFVTHHHLQQVNLRLAAFPDLFQLGQNPFRQL